MHGLTVKYRRMPGNKALAEDLTWQLAKSSHCGKSVVVTDEPLTLLTAVRKQWSGTGYDKIINATRALQSVGRPVHALNVTLTAKPPEDLLEADITFATIDDFIRVAPDCKTMYVTYDFPKIKLHMATSWMPRNGVVVIYG